MENSSGSKSASDLGKLKLADLQAMASERGLKGTSRMRKSELVNALSVGDTTNNSSSKKSSASTAPAGAEKPNDDKRRGAASKKGRAASEDGGASKETKPKQELEQDSKQDLGEPKQEALDAVVEELKAARKSRPESRESGSATELAEIELPEGGEPGRSRNRRDRGQRRRGRGRDRAPQSGGQQNGNQRGQQRDSEPEITDEDSLVPIAGIVDVQNNHAFVRTSGYLPGDSDVYVTLGNVRRWGLRPGDAVVGYVRQMREGEQRRQQQKYNALVKVDSINGMTLEQAAQRREFAKLTPEYPKEQLRLETSPKAITPRMIDLVAPIGKGQRGLIVSPPKAGKTMIIQQIAKAIEINNPDVHLMVVLVDERPEEVTDMRSIVKGEVIASTFDRPASDHTIVAELAIERAKRLVELGQDVVVLLDSITRLSRAYNLAAPASGRILSGGVDAAALYPPKKFFGAARNLREGGSLTIIASALVETGSKMDEVIFEEFKGTGNMELRLSRSLADRRIFPAIDINASGTRREEMLFKPEELAIMWKLRRVLGNLDQQAALESVLGRLKDTQQNAEFLMQVQRTTAE
ncbi:transcription termination factor Rho [Actinomycetaceae bacterium MB13-C1-2]|nr:transcription termination factor Rho [Actinomycetaceae bacterium MB13-C1-2]